MQPLNLDTWQQLVATRPVAVVDLETTGDDPETCGVCEIGVTAYGPAEVAAAYAAIAGLEPGQLVSLPTPAPAWRYPVRVNPGQPIHPAATAVHGITDEMVAACPGVEAVMPNLQQLADAYTLVTFNGRRFDLRVLQRLGLRVTGPAIDVMGLVRAGMRRPVAEWFGPGEREAAGAGRPPPRLVGEQIMRAGGSGSESTGAPKVFRDSLEGAHYALLGYPAGDAHQAVADCVATARVLFAAIALWRFPDDPAALAAVADDALADVREIDGHAVLVSGKKHRGVRVVDILATDPTYLGWLLCSPDYHDDDKARVVAAIGKDRADELVVAQTRKQQYASGGRGGRGSRAKQPAA